MNKLFRLLLFILLASFLFVKCTKNNIDIHSESKFSLNSCECTTYLIESNGIPSFSSIETFRDAYNCLSQCHENYLDEINQKYSEISDEEYDNLVEQGIIQEWKILDDFSKYGGYKSLLERDLALENKWLSNGAVIEQAPNEIIFDDVLKAMIDKDCNVEINGEIVTFCEDLVGQRRLKWCSPFGTNHRYITNGDYRIRISGGIAYPNIFTGSFITGKIVAYKKKHGKWKRNRERLTIGASCTVRRSPLNECELLNDPAVTGFKSRKRKSLSVTKFNWLNLQIWYKKPLSSNPSYPDGLVSGNSEHIGATIGF